MNSDKTFKDLIGCKILYSAGYFVKEIGTVQQVSPNGRYVMINSNWWTIYDVEILDQWPAL